MDEPTGKRPEVTAGRMVTYRGEDGRDRPAVVATVVGGENPRETVHLTVFDMREECGTSRQWDVPHDKSHACKKHSWRWPVRV
jgi:hypothetical protein